MTEEHILVRPSLASSKNGSAVEIALERVILMDDKVVQ